MKEELTEIKALPSLVRWLFVALVIWIGFCSCFNMCLMQYRFEELNKNIITNNENQLLIIENQALINRRIDSLKVKSKYLH